MHSDDGGVVIVGSDSEDESGVVLYFQCTHSGDRDENAIVLYMIIQYM